MLTIAIDRADQLRQGHVPLAGDLLQTVPELVFKAARENGQISPSTKRSGYARCW
jgi:hypothetical protein